MSPEWSGNARSGFTAAIKAVTDNGQEPETLLELRVWYYDGLWRIAVGDVAARIAHDQDEVGARYECVAWARSILADAALRLSADIQLFPGFGEQAEDFLLTPTPSRRLSCKRCSVTMEDLELARRHVRTMCFALAICDLFLRMPIKPTPPRQQPGVPLKVALYRPTPEFAAIATHVAVAHQADDELVALTGPADDQRSFRLAEAVAFSANHLADICAAGALVLNANAPGVGGDYPPRFCYDEFWEAGAALRMLAFMATGDAALLRDLEDRARESGVETPVLFTQLLAAVARILGKADVCDSCEGGGKTREAGAAPGRLADCPGCGGSGQVPKRQAAAPETRTTPRRKD